MTHNRKVGMVMLWFAAAFFGVAFVFSVVSVAM